MLNSQDYDHLDRAKPQIRPPIAKELKCPACWAKWTAGWAFDHPAFSCSIFDPESLGFDAYNVSRCIARNNRPRVVQG